MLVLASASPRRQELLRNAGIPFVVQPGDVDETPRPSESPRDCAERLARDKALAVWRTRPQDTVLGADTVVAVDGAILGKPSDAADAARMLRLLAGRTHEVITGVCVVAGLQSSMVGQGAARTGQSGIAQNKLRFANPELATASETTLVTMNAIADGEIEAYVQTGEPMDKAGAYAIQGLASRWIPRIAGDYSNVVGLPVALVRRMLTQNKSQIPAG